MRKNTFKRFIRRKMAVVSAFILLFFVLIAILGPIIFRKDPYAIDLRNTRQPISKEHWLGTDDLGRDTFTRLVYGTRITLAVSFAGVFIGTVVGVLLGVCAGYYGGLIDTVLSRLIDIILAFPSLLLAIAVVAILGRGLENTIIAIAVSSTPSVARMVRSVTLSIRNQEYIMSCEISGVPHRRIIATHVIPNTMSQIIVNTTLNLGTGILSASSLSFLGLGVQPPHPEWGAMLSTARDTLRFYPLASLAPGIAVTLVVLSFSLVGDGLRDALDPKLKNR